jgi:hypothetical protein
MEDKRVEDESAESALEMLTALQRNIIPSLDLIILL